ncbi:MAG: TonB-dependent receptor [Gammaproteobacteria bacterium]
MSLRRGVATGLVLAGTAGLLQPAVAQTQAAFTTEELESIFVIGTRIGERTVLDTPVPVDVLAGDELRATGVVAGELGQALSVLAPSFNFPRQSNSGSSDLVRAGQLRGMSPDQMLVLVNGRRRHTSAIVNTETKIGRGTAAVDFNNIPLNAIQRVEVLRDGAGALYGSDAIAGVVNLVLDDRAGFEANASYGSHLTDLEPVNEDLTDGETFTFDAKYGWTLADEGFLKTGVAWRTRNSTNRAGFDQVPFFEQQTPDNLALAGQRNYAEGDPNVDELNLWFNGSVPLGSAELYGFGTYGNRDSDGGAAFFRYPDSTSTVKEVYPSGFRPETWGEDEDYAATAGLRAEAGGWDLDAALSYGRNEFVFGVDNSINASLGPDSPTSFESGTYENEQVILGVDAGREFAVGWLRAPLEVAVGAEYRTEDYATTRGQPESYAAGNFGSAGCATQDDPPGSIDFLCAIGAQAAPGLTPDDEVSIDRSVVSVYADLGTDLTNRLFVEVAARYEDYDDFGSAVTGKLAGLYALTDAASFRAAVSTSFRAPNIAQLGFSDTTLNFGDDRALIRTRTLRVDDPIARSLGAKDLDEEHSFNLSAGVVGQFDGLRVSVDVFQIDVDDRITLSERLFSAPLTDFIQAQPGGGDIESVRFFTNAVDTQTRGFDVVASYAQPWLGGEFQTSIAFNYSQTEVETIRGTTPELAAVDPTLTLVGVEELNTLEDATPDSKLILSGNWSGDKWDLLGRVSRYENAVRVFNFGGGFEPRQEYGAEIQVDAEVGYRFTEQLALYAGAANLLDAYPDLSIPDINFFGNLPYDILSPIGVNGRYVYARASFRL